LLVFLCLKFDEWAEAQELSSAIKVTKFFQLHD